MEKGYPTDLAIKANIHHLAWHALICQSKCLVPIVEPDISLSGFYTLEEAVEVNIHVQLELFKAMSMFLFFAILHLFLFS
jgi:fructose-bisphosphate aldolase class I